MCENFKVYFFTAVIQMSLVKSCKRTFNYYYFIWGLNCLNNLFRLQTIFVPNN